MDNNDIIINTFYNKNYIKPPENCVNGNSNIKLNILNTKLILIVFDVLKKTVKKYISY